MDSGLDLESATERTRLLKLAYLLTGDRQLAEDIVQTVVLRFLEGRGQNARHPSAYARRSIVNEAASTHRDRARYRELLRRAARLKPGQVTATPEQLIGERLVVLKALACLTPRERAAIVLRYYEDLDDAASARIIGCSRSTVRTLVQRALPKLKRALDAEGAGNEVDLT